jgi:hypothetical protein
MRSRNELTGMARDELFSNALLYKHRAIDMIGRESGGMYVHSEELEAAHMTADPSSTGATLSRKPQQQRRRVAPIDGELDNSFKIDTLSSQLGMIALDTSNVCLMHIL